jgi:hypothetical protein
VALRTHPEWLKGMDKDNLSWVAGVKVEVSKNKRYEDELSSGGKGRGKKNKGYDFFNKDTRTN